MTHQSDSTNAGSQGKDVTVINADVQFFGRLLIKGTNEIVVRGLVEGEIESNGLVRIEAGGVVRGAITTAELDVAGEVQTDRDVRVHNLLTMRTGGVVVANKVVYGDLINERGAYITGEIEPCEPMKGPAEQVKVASKVELNQLPGVPASLLAVPRPAIAPTPVSAVPAPVKGVTELPFRADAKAVPSAPELDRPSSVRDLERAVG